MPRVARIVVPGAAHHITQRGNNRQAVFLDDEDREKYLTLLYVFSVEFQLRILGYCLMSNHVHLVAVPKQKSSLVNAIGRTHQQYADYFHGKYERVGHLWQGRFFSCPMDEDYTLRALVYVELNPVRAGLCAAAPAYAWSSAAAHLALREDGLLDLDRWFTHFTPESWGEVIGGLSKDEALIREVRYHTRRGTPWGRSTGFVERVRMAKAGD